MKFIHILWFVLLLPVQITSQLFLRIPINKVEYTINDFLNIHDFNNCFQNRISIKSLDLKCWKLDGLYTIHLNIEKTYDNPEYSEYSEYDHNMLNYIEDQINVFAI